MDVLITLLALTFLMVVAYRGFSVILFAPLAALLAVLLTGPSFVLPFYSGVFMERMAGFVQLYFPVFLLGALFGKLMEVSGSARSLIRALIGLVGPNHAILSIVLACALLTYGGVSLFVVAFSVYPFAAELFRSADIPKRLIPPTIALGAFTFTMDALPGSPQIQNIIPTSFFGTDAWAAPWLGLSGAMFLLVTGMAYLEWRRRRAKHAGEGYGEGHSNEPALTGDEVLPHPALAVAPLVLVGVLNKLFTVLIGHVYGDTFEFQAAGVTTVPPIEVDRVTGIWAVEGALFIGVLVVLVISLRRIRPTFNPAAHAAIGGAMLATLNTGSEYGFGGVISLLPGFHAARELLSHAIGNPLVNVAVTTNILSGITGSASGGMSIVLASMGRQYLSQAQASGIPAEVLHRVTAMASGGMDTLPHNGAIITLLAITGLTHRQSYRDIFAMTILKIVAAFLAIGLYYAFGIV